MASSTQEMLYDSFGAVAEGLATASAAAESAKQMSALTSGVGLVGQVVQAATSSQGRGNAVLSTVSKLFTSGLGLGPLFGGLFGLFGGGS